MSPLRNIVLALALLAIFALPPALARAPVPAPAPARTSPERELLDYPTIHHPVKGNRGMVVSQNEIASGVGADILRRGGTAVDAAVAVSFALAVTLPRAGNIGGDGFMLVHIANQGALAIDYRSVAPRAAKTEMFLDRKGRKADNSERGYSAAAVPGTVAGLAHAHRRFGKLPWADLVTPAAELAEKGVPLSHDAAYALNWARNRLSGDATARAVLTKPLNWRAGEILRQPALAATLRAIAKEGPDAFYKGSVARTFAAAMKAHGGLVTLEDLAAYKPVERAPLSGNYRGHQYLTMPPPSGGGVSIVLTLNILEQFDLKSMGAGSADAVHILAEAMKLAYADRTRFVGDPGFIQLPTGGLASKGYARERAKLISPRRVLKASDIAPGDPRPFLESPDTTHISVADAQGSVVSMTTTLGSSFGASTMVENAGFLLNNQMKNFALEYGTRDVVTLSTSPANRLEPGKRMMSTMAPAIVLRGGRPWIVTGTPGGSTIHNTIIQLLVNVIDHGMNIADATHAPRIHQQWKPEGLKMEPGFSPDTVRLLTGRGHRVERDETMGSAQSIVIEDGLFHGAADPRRPGAAAVAP